MKMTRHRRALNVLLVIDFRLVQYRLINILIKTIKVTICRIQGIQDIKYLLWYQGCKCCQEPWYPIKNTPDPDGRDFLLLKHWDSILLCMKLQHKRSWVFLSKPLFLTKDAFALSKPIVERKRQTHTVKQALEFTVPRKIAWGWHNQLVFDSGRNAHAMQ